MKCFASGAVLLLGVFLAGCGTVQPSNPFLAHSSEIVLEVENQSGAEVEIRMPRQDGRVLGSLRSGMKTEFQIPWRQPGEFRVEIFAVSGRRYLTPPVSARPRDRIRLMVPSNISSSRLY